MKHLIDKDDLEAEIKRRKGINEKAYMQAFLNSNDKRDSFGYKVQEDIDILSYLNTLEVKTDEDNFLEKFKSLQHISGDLHQTLEDWGYAPNLYFFDGVWHVSWISCEEGDSIKDFEGNTPEEAIDKAYNWFHSTFCNS